MQTAFFRSGPSKYALLSNLSSFIRGVNETKLGFFRRGGADSIDQTISLKSECDGRTLENSTVVLCFDD